MRNWKERLHDGCLKGEETKKVEDAWEEMGLVWFGFRGNYSTIVVSCCLIFNF